MNWKFWKRGTPPTLDEIKERAERRIATRDMAHAGKIARIKRKAERRQAKLDAGDKPRTIAVRMVQFSGFAAVVAGIAVALAGYWYDILFYAQQADEWYIVWGLVAFAFTLRTVAVFVPIVLQWAKPPQNGPKERRYLFRFWKNKPTNMDLDGDGEVTVQEFIAANRLARATLRFLFVGSVIGCSFATLSFFSSGHETRQAAVASIEARELTSVAGKNERIDSLRGSLEDARKDRDTDIASAQFAIAAIRDEVVGMSAADNESIRKLQDDITKYRNDYVRTRDAIQTQINGILNEKEAVESEATKERGDSAPFLSVYTFLSRTAGDQAFWAVTGAWFFTILFELLIAFFPGAMFELFRALTGRVRVMEAHESQQSLRWNLDISQFESHVRMQELKARAAQEAEEANFLLDQARRKAWENEQRASMDAEIAEIERRAREARERLDAIAAGEDPDSYDSRKALERAQRQAEADRKRAEAERELAKIKAETERIRRETEEATKPKPALTPAQQRSENANMAKELLNETRNQIPKIPAGDWSNRADRQEQAA